VTATTAGEPHEPPCPHRRPAPCLAQVVLGHLQVVGANRFDHAIAAGPVDQLHPDELAPPGKLAKSERQLVPARGRPGAGRSVGGSAGRATEPAGPYRIGCSVPSVARRTRNSG